MNGHWMFELAHDLAVAKSRQDVSAALRLLYPKMLLESPAFGTRACGPAENKLALTRFFASFPITTSPCTATPATATPWSAGVRPG
jgi:hypothetical protein